MKISTYPSPEELLSEEFLAQYRTKQVPWGFNGLGYIVYLRTYSRDIDDKKTKENWIQTISRCIRGAQRIGAGYTVKEAEILFDHIFNLRCNFAGRCLWQLGTPMVDKLCGNSLINCYFTVLECIEDFCFVFENLMLGGGVTGSVRREHIHQLPKVKEIKVEHIASKDADFIVPDSRQGWIELLRKVLTSAFVTGNNFTYSTILVRGYGEPIKTFGGTASGPQILIDGISQIVKVINSRTGKKLRSIDVLDIFNIIASIVVAGNVRRSAELALGDADDILFLRAKRWDLGSIPNWRAMSNNTICADKYDYTSNEFWNGYLGNGEPYGLFNLSLSQDYGRIIDGPMKKSDLYPQKHDNCVGTNPCITKDTIIATSDGPKTVENLINNPFTAVVDNKKYKSSSNGFFKTGTKEVFCLSTIEGFNLKCTKDHKILVSREKSDVWVEAQNLKENDRIIINKNSNLDWGGVGTYEEGWLLGSILGDGYINGKRANVSYWGNNKNHMIRYAKECADSLDDVTIRSDFGSADLESKNAIFYDRIGASSASLKTLCDKYKLYSNKELSQQIEITSRKFHIGFLRGWFDADGTVIGNQRKGISVRLCSIKLNNLFIAQRMLQRLGIYSTIYQNRKESGYKFMPDGHGGQKEYMCQSVHELCITRDSIVKFDEIVGFADPDKSEKLKNKISAYKEIYKSKWYARFLSLKSVGVEDVYDATIEDIHRFDANGLIIHNCSEISLYDGEVCNLSELYLNNIESKDQLIECAKLLYKTQKAICSLNYLHEKTNKIVHKNMRIGLGITGICQSQNKLDWLDGCYRELRNFDKEWSRERGWNESIKLTTIKPSGCSRKDSLILTNKGLLRLDEIGNVYGDQWQDIDNLQNDSKFNIKKFYINGRVKTKILKTLDGFEYESSLNHRYWINGQWKYVNDIQTGDNLTVKIGGYSITEEPEFKSLHQDKITNSIIIKQPTKMNPDLAFFLGLFYADGSVHEKGIRISFNRRDNDLICLLKQIILDNFGIQANIDDDHGLYINSTFLKEWLEHNGILKNYCEKLSLPKIIRQSSTESAKAFITGFWRGDGGQHNIGNWSLCSVSKEFVQDIGVLMRSLGYNVSIKNAGPGGYGKIDRWILLNRTTIPNRYQSKEFKSRYIDNNMWIDPVVEIIDSENDTYDIEVDSVHEYILNGVVSHNTLSLLAGSTPGVHPAYDKYYIRRVRIGAIDPTLDLCRKIGYHIEPVERFDGTLDTTTFVVSFPCREDTAVLAKDMSAIDQLELVKKLQSEWSDNSISVTVYYRDNELDSIKEWLKNNYEDNLKTVSFLRHSDHGFRQAPYESISEERYNQMIGKLDLSQINSEFVGDACESQDSLECANGVCPVR